MVINKWFPVREYGFASSLIVATFITMVVGFGASGLAFSRPGQDTKETLNSLIWNSNVFISFVFVFFMLTFKAKPDVPPSRVAE